MDTVTVYFRLEEEIPAAQLHANKTVWVAVQLGGQPWMTDSRERAVHYLRELREQGRTVRLLKITKEVLLG